MSLKGQQFDGVQMTETNATNAFNGDAKRRARYRNSVIHTTQFKCDLKAVYDRDITIHRLIAVRDFKPHLKFERIASALSIFGCARRIFLFFVTVEPPCCV